MKHNTTTSTPTAAAPAADSPSKMSQVTLRSKYLEQIREIHSLFDMGALTATEYDEQSNVPSMDLTAPSMDLTPGAQYKC